MPPARDSANTVENPDLKERVRGLMPELKADLDRLVAMPSVSEVGLPRGDPAGAPPDA